MINRAFQLTFIFISAQLFAQVPAKNQQPLPFRQVTGIVTDSIQQVVIGASVTLISKADTLKTITNEVGLYSFERVNAWEFTLSVSSLGYRTYVKVGKYNDATGSLVMQPINLREDYHVLNEVVINGTPRILYKTDTVEYKASDYVVREGAGVDEMLKKMEGMDVGTDGSLSYNGKPVAKARLNGKDFMGGNIASTIQNLPADIVEKIQIVDDYGDQAARTGIKDGNPTKLLNITTKADRSVGYIGKIRGGFGNNTRHDGSINGTRINANQIYTLAGSTNNIINGNLGNISGTSTSGSPNGTANNSGGLNGIEGLTERRTAGFTYRDDWSSKINANINYGYQKTKSNLINESVARDFSTRGTTFSTNTSNGNNYSDTHNFTFEFEADADSANYFKIIPVLSYNSTVDDNQSSAFLSGLIHQDQNSINTIFTKNPNYGLTVFYMHLFPKEGRNVSLQLSGSKRKNEHDREQNTNIVFFQQLTDAILRDSLIHRSIERDNLGKNYRSSLTFSEPLGIGKILEFNGQITYKANDNHTITSNFTPIGPLSVIDSLSNIFKYSFTQARVSLSYRYQNKKRNLSLGITGIPGLLRGNNISQGTNVRLTSFNIIPLLRYQYSWTSRRKFTINYSGNALEPSFSQIQPVKDVSNPQSPVIGNANLKPSFNHVVQSTYSHYVPNSRFSINADLNTAYYANRVIVNVVQVEDSYNALKYERHYLNKNGAYHVGGNYTLTKQLLANPGYNFTIAGNLHHLHDIGMSNNIINISKQWSFMKRLSARISPSDAFEINPSVAYRYYLADNSLPTAPDSKIKILSFQVDGKNYFAKSWIVGYTAGKNFVHGINSSLSGNPFIMNLYIERKLFNRNAGTLRVQGFDLFNENKIINRSVTGTGITDTRSNSLNRYFMISMSVTLQRWKGTPNRNGEELKRRGDGSFIY